MTVERNRCDFCGEVKDVSRQYLHAARPRKFEETGCDPHTMTRYCNDCGLKEIIVKEAPMTASNPCCEHCEKRVRDRGYIGKGQSRQYLVGVHLECKNPTCSCHPAALKPQPAKEWWEEPATCHCGKVFKKYRPMALYCSYQCRDAARYYRDRAERLKKRTARSKANYTTEGAYASFLKRKEKEPEKIAARTALRNAVTQGKVSRKPCEECGEKEVDGHHTDYSKPLDVRWLCESHHYKLHRSKYGHLGN